MQASKLDFDRRLRRERTSIAHRGREAKAVRSGLVAIALTLTFALGCSVENAPAAALKAMWGPGTRDGVSLFPTFKELGVTIYEDQLRWNLIALRRPKHPRDPNDPAYVWPAEVTQSVAEAKRYGMKVALQIIFAPRWANGNLPPQWVPWYDSDYANFAVAAAKRYPSVHLWMIWGEPSRSRNFRPLTPAKPFVKLDAHQRIAPHLYARMLDASYGALKGLNRANIVIGGMTDSAASISPQQWIENLRLPDGRPPRLDMYGHNPFSLRAPNLANPPSPDQQIDFSDLGRLEHLVDHYLGRPGNRRPKLFLSEWTIPTAPERTFNFYVERRLQALWITDGLRVASELPNVYAVGWIPLYDELPNTSGGLIEADGTKKPGYFAWQSG
jgi:hypothetical protein